MRCPECHTHNSGEAAACQHCGLLLLKLQPEQHRRADDLAQQHRRATDVPAQHRRADDLARQQRRASDAPLLPCRFCGGEIPQTAIRCRHCAEIVNDEFYRQRAKRVRSRINYSSWVAYLFGLAALFVLKPVGIISIAAGLLLSIIYYAIPVEPSNAPRGKRTKVGELLRRQFAMERVAFPIPFVKNKKLVLVGTPLVAAIVGYTANFMLLQQPMNEVLRGNTAFNGMEVSAHYKYWVVPGVVEYDLEALSIRQTPIDVHTALVEFAGKVKAKRYSRVDLAYQGVTKFSVDGSAFQRLGEEYSKGNFDWVLYEFPRRLRGDEAGKAATTNRDALVQFHRQWYGRDMMTEPVLTTGM